MMNNEKNTIISIIIPVYNTRNYLRYCLESIKSQTFKNFEVFIIDDGSNDGSEIICDEYATLDCRFKVIHQKNQGLSAARNYGIEIAKGDYILFVDSDDYISSDLCEKCYDFAKSNNADLIRFFYKEDTKQGYRFLQKQLTLPKSEIRNDVDKLRVAYTSGAMVWKFFIKRLLLINNKLRFPLNVIYEDMSFTTKLALSAEKMHVLPECLYVYRIRKESLSWSKQPNAVGDCKTCCEQGIDYAKNRGSSKEVLSFLLDQEERLLDILKRRGDTIFNEEYPKEIFYE